MEFLEDGGVLTLLDILSRLQSKEEDKTEVLQLLLTISNAGRKYKEIICESHGTFVTETCFIVNYKQTRCLSHRTHLSAVYQQVQMDQYDFYSTVGASILPLTSLFFVFEGVSAITECMAKSNAEEIQMIAWMLMDSLSKGNPKYQSQVHKSLNAVLPNATVTSDRKVRVSAIQILPAQDTSSTEHVTLD